MLKRLFRLSWLRRSSRQLPDFPQPSLDPNEFTRLLCSGRVEDLRILAKKLSRQARPRLKPFAGIAAMRQQAVPGSTRR
jgi:hypothetical protein